MQEIGSGENLIRRTAMARQYQSEVDNSYRGSRVTCRELGRTQQIMNGNVTLL